MSVRARFFTRKHRAVFTFLIKVINIVRIKMGFDHSLKTKYHILILLL